LISGESAEDGDVRLFLQELPEPGENDMLVETLADLRTRIVKAAGINDTPRVV